MGSLNVNARSARLVNLSKNGSIPGEHGSMTLARAADSKVGYPLIDNLAFEFYIIFISHKFDE